MGTENMTRTVKENAMNSARKGVGREGRGRREGGWGGGRE